ncbi:MAG: antibiotic biosynthesis monooxygenase [Mycobacteriaceae bacterium]|nr:antibiotic biosynthesis monooxygenase [Mycobacteriaceae bacterium]
MVIVAGFIVVNPLQREGYLANCAEVTRQARRTPGCLDFAITADPLDPARVDIFELWTSQAAADAFRGSGPGGEQQDAIVSGCVCEYDVTDERRLL